MKIVLGLNSKVKEINIDGDKIKADAKHAAVTTGNAIKHGVSSLLNTAIEGLSKAKSGIKVDHEYLSQIESKIAAERQRKEKEAATKAQIKELKASI
jgi:hypothetical protein